MLNVVSALYLLLRRGNAIAPEVTSPIRLRRWAAAFLFVCAFSHVSWIVYFYHPSPAFYALVCGLDLLLLFPTIAGILLSMLQDRRRPVWPVLALLVPALVLLALSGIRGDDFFYTPLIIYVLCLYAFIMLFLFLAVRRYGRWLRDNYADLENKEVWQSLLLLAVFMLLFVMYSSTTGGSPIMEYLLQIDCIIIVGLLLWRVETLQQLNVSTSAPEAEPVEDAQKDSTPKPVPVDIAPLLKKYCESRRLYLRHDLTLAQLAQAIGTNHFYLSQFFSQQGITYNAYINGLRIRHFTRLYKKAVADGRVFTAKQLAFESGYHSYSTFSAAFRQSTGKTVTTWIHDASE